MQRIDEHRKRLIEQRRWTDRNDQVDAATVEWMHSLGYEVGQPQQDGGARGIAARSRFGSAGSFGWLAVLPDCLARSFSRGV